MGPGPGPAGAIMKHELATVHHLPHELISYIFSIGRDGDDNAIPYLRTISSVCSVWRDVAISTSNLWTTIVYEPYAFPPPTHPQPIFIPLTRRRIESEASRVCERVETFLVRSRSSSIDLVVIIREHNVKQIQRITNIVMSHLWRCRSLTICYDDSAVPSTFFPLPGRLERLEKLESLAQHHASFGAATLFTEHSAPSLRTLCLTPAHGLARSMDFIPNTLTRLDLVTGLEAIGRVKFMQFLRQCTMLERLRLLELLTRDLLPDNFIPVSLPSLKSLHVYDTLALDFRMYLSTPNIVELHLSGDMFHPGVPPEPPNAQPTMLQIETVKWDRQSLRGLRHHMMPFSSVKNLILRDCVGVSDLVCYLATGFPDEPVQTPTDPLEALSRLEYMGIEDSGDEENDEEGEMAETTQWLKILLSRRASLRVAVTRCVIDDPAAFAEQFGARFAVVEREWHSVVF